MTEFYKVLDGDRSCDGGDWRWSLPTADGPGAWQEIPATESLELCARGLHLTSDPVAGGWYRPGREVYLAEIDTTVPDAIVGPRPGGDKVAVRRCRLVKRFSDTDLVALRIAKVGHVDVLGSSWLALGSSQVTARDSSQVTALGSSQVTALGSSRVEARDSSRVEARDSSRVEARDSSQVTARGSSRVEARGSSRVEARDSSRVTALGSSRVEARDRSQVTALGSSQVTARDSSQVEAWGRSVVVVRSGNPTVVLHENAVRVDQRGERPRMFRAKRRSG